MTKQYLSSVDRREPVMKWINEHPLLRSGRHEAALSVQDVDAVIHRYWVRDATNGRRLEINHIMLIEIKTYRAKPDNSQRNTLNVLHCTLSRGNGISVQSKIDGFVFEVFYHGVHLLQLSHETPNDSDVMWWDTEPITTEQLVKLLRFELDAKTLRPREDYEPAFCWCI